MVDVKFMTNRGFFQMVDRDNPEIEIVEATLSEESQLNLRLKNFFKHSKNPATSSVEKIPFSSEKEREFVLDISRLLTLDEVFLDYFVLKTHLVHSLKAFNCFDNIFETQKVCVC
jgi:hypothetical protein